MKAKSGIKKRSKHPSRSLRSIPPVRFAVVGLGHIAQAAVLPAFAHARNADLVALVSEDPQKLKQLGNRYKVAARYSPVQLEECIREEGIEAVYLAVPNALHREYATRVATAGAHILCEKPLATTAEECLKIIDSAAEHRVHLMTAYRLHFEAANLEAIRLIQSGKIGDPRFFNSIFSFQVKPGNIRLAAEMGGGALFDIGTYCINAARYVFRAEPESVFAQFIGDTDRRFQEVESTCSALLRFPGDRIAQFTCSFETEAASYFEVFGSKGSICVDPAYEYEEGLAIETCVRGKTSRKRFAKTDQFAAELIYFSECIRLHKDPEPSGWEGLADLRVIDALRVSARTGRSVELAPFDKRRRPTPAQEISEPASREDAPLVHVESPSAS